MNFCGSGKVLVHPDLDRPILSSIQPLFTDLVHFENIADAADLQKRMTQYSFFISNPIFY